MKAEEGLTELLVCRGTRLFYSSFLTIQFTKKNTETVQKSSFHIYDIFQLGAFL